MARKWGLKWKGPKWIGHAMRASQSKSDLKLLDSNLTNRYVQLNPKLWYDCEGSAQMYPNPSDKSPFPTLL